MKRTIALASVLSLSALPALTLTPNSHASYGDPLKQYLDCINQQTKGDNSENSDRVVDAQKVLDACANERQAVLNNATDEDDLRQLERIEQHLKGRESKEKSEK